jgi:hypothetical protein
MDPDHCFVCPSNRGARTIRHNIIKDGLKHAMQHIFGLTVIAETAMSDANNIARNGDTIKKKKTDLEFIVGNNNAPQHIDITVIHPTAPSYFSPISKRAKDQLKPSPTLITKEQVSKPATRREMHKILKYKKSVEFVDGKFHPFVLETYGSYGTATIEFIRSFASIIASHHKELFAYNEIITYLYALTSVLLNRGNAVVARQYLQLHPSALPKSSNTSVSYPLIKVTKIPYSSSC